MAAAPPGPSVKDIPVRQLYKRADNLETKLNVASENGLFEHQDKVSHEAILTHLTEAMRLSLQKNLLPEEYAQALRALDTAQNLYDKAIEAAGLRNRLNYVYGIPALSYLMLMLALIVWVILELLPNSPSQQTFLSIPVQILLSGSIGAILRGITALWYRVNRMEYRKVWGTWILLNPFVGALLGGLVYLAFFASIVVSTLSMDLANPALAILVSMIAGYNWEWAYGVLDKVVQAFSVKGG